MAGGGEIHGLIEIIRLCNRLLMNPQDSHRPPSHIRVPVIHPNGTPCQ